MKGEKINRFREAERFTMSPVSVYVDKTQQSLNGKLVFESFRTTGGYVNNGRGWHYHGGNLMYIPVIKSKEYIKPFDDYSKVVVAGEYGFTTYYGGNNNLIGLKSIEKIPEDIYRRLCKNGQPEQEE